MNFTNGSRMKGRVFRGSVIAMLVGFCLSVGTSGQSSETQTKMESSPLTAEITRFFVEEPKKDSGYETGPLHIIYGDGTEIVKALPPLKASTEKEIVYNAVGFSGVQLAEDRRTLGWTIDVEGCCQSYAIPMGLSVFKKTCFSYVLSRANGLGLDVCSRRSACSGGVWAFPRTRGRRLSALRCKDW
jgi:hypothetical protein